MSNWVDKREEKQHKKRRRIAKAGAWSVGIGVGLFIARLIAPLFITPDPATNAAFGTFSLALVLYGAVQLGAVAFVGKHAGKVDTVLTYIILPAIILKIIMDYSS